MRRSHAVRSLIAAGAALVGLTATLGAAPAGHAEDGAGDLPVNYNFLLGAIAAGAKLDADPPGGNDWTCRPTAAHPRPVVLVHGTLGNKNTNWQAYSPLLKNNGYCVYSLNYGVIAGTPPPINQFGGLGNIKDSAQELKVFVDQVLAATGARKVDIIGHSQGTFMPEYYAKFLGGASKIKKYISLAPLWHGTKGTMPLSMIAKGFGIAEDDFPVCAACVQMGNESQFLARLREGGLLVGNIEYTNIMTKYDELVRPYTSGSEPGMRNLVVQDYCKTDFSEHFEIASDPVGAQLVLNTLDPAHPQPVPCMVVLPFIGPLGG
ncbi:alpha/beta fold hydrolase [Nocardioides humilatus]|uniref:Alpha/beta fold hydrolase n=1 Tax=Nocardioides humilatus TaxID=2607660 RepID=A0A5B1L5K7_9ACTN|nr:alpha/beta fold hydrolase [Nocardioides humilatus]KAA1415448.1 alpha/beta fold hydrolase [Nocardioides humilatus]